MGCKIEDAIFKISKISEKDKIMLWIDEVLIHGTIHCCGDADKDKCKCLDEVLTLENVEEYCHGEKKEYKWLHIPTKNIKCFTFQNNIE